MSDRRILAGAVLLVLCAVLPPLGSGYVQSVFYIAVLYIALAYGWNLIAGYAGYLSFGQVTFFGIGAYAVALGVTQLHLPWLLCAFAGGVISAALAIPLGYLMLRLRGPFFALGMLGLAQTTRIAAEATPFTGGSAGVYLPPGSNALPAYYWTLAVMALAMGLTLWVDRSTFGLRLRALRADERAAGTLGVDVTRFKVTAFVLSAIVPGLLGGGYAWYLTYVDPASVFSTHIELQTVAMVILGGVGTFWGPLVGGALMSQISESLGARFPQGHLMIFGGLVVVLLIALPRGIVPAIATALAKRPARG
ncbi:MAG: branched-chain amino acid ABC transporter permease [Candidatus Elarobacter sp.]